MKDIPLEDLHLELWWLISLTRDTIYKARKRELWQYKIYARHSIAMLAIQELGDKATVAAVAKRLLREHHSTFELLTRMEKEGLVSKIRDLDRKNAVRVVLTDKGRQFRQKTLIMASINRIMSSLSDKECQCLKSHLEKLLKSAMAELKATCLYKE